MAKQRKLEDKLVERTKKKEGGCWEWTGCRNRCGYGLIGHVVKGKKKVLLAHRVAFAFYVGEIPEKMCVCHTCDNPSCVNPEHLWLGTHAENMRDKSLKGRLGGLKGEKHPRAKLSRELVKEIRFLYATGEFSHNGLAETFKVSKAAVYYITTGKTWK
jgi:hypothetical protein